MNDYDLALLSNALTPKMTKYIPWEPMPKQAAFMLLDCREAFYGGACFGGKDLYICTDVLTTNGWTTMEHLKIGDYVFDECGQPTKIIAISEIFRNKPCYKLIFSDETEVIASETHEWITSTFKERMKGKFHNNDYDSISSKKTTKEIANTLKTAHKRNCLNHTVKVAKPLNYSEKKLIIEPYILGLWLTDGSKRDASYTTKDIEIIKNIKSFGYEVTPYPQQYKFYIQNLKEKLNKYDLVNNKHIPNDYLTGSINQRLELLQGLMDGDGTADKKYGGLKIVMNNKSLMEQIYELIRSLGIKAVLKSYKFSKCNYIMYGITFFSSLPMFKLKRKLEKQKLKDFNGRFERLYIKSVIEISSVPTKCIKVDSPSEQFLVTKSLIPTHNSIALLMSALQYVDVPGYNAILFRKTLAELELPEALMDVAQQWLTPFKKAHEVRWIDRRKTWVFPSGAKLTFGYLEGPKDKYRYSSAAFHFIGFDEATAFDEEDYTFLFSRCRRTKQMVDVPLRIRAASNPGQVGHCVPFGEILTPSGWKDIKTFKINDPIYTISKDKEIQETRVEQVHIEDYNGLLINVDQKNLKMVCTPNHCVAKLYGTKKIKNEIFSLVPFIDLPNQSFILRTAIWKGIPKYHFSKFSTPEVKTRKLRNNQPLELTSKDFIELFGWVITEGNIVDRDKAFCISQQKQPYKNQIEKLLKRCGFKYTLSGATFTIYSPQWYSYFKQFGKCRDKYIPDYIKNTDSNNLKILFDTMIKGDGSFTKSEGAQFFTTSKKLADDFSEIAFKLGYIVYCSSRQRENRKGLSYYISATKNKLGATELITNQHCYNVKTVMNRKSDIYLEPYNGKVYCLGVPNTHSFIIRQNGSIWISGNSWVKKRFLDEKNLKGRVFIPATMSDNIYGDLDSYIENMQELDPITRAQLMEGNWEVTHGGKVFKREWFEGNIIRELPDGYKTRLRYWDLAATKAKEFTKTKYDPAFTSGIKMSEGAGIFYIEDVKRAQDTSKAIEDLILKTAIEDGPNVDIWFEEEPGSQSKGYIGMLAEMLKGYNVRSKKETEHKMVRAQRTAGDVERGKVKLLEGYWNKAFIDEAELFGNPGVKMDQIDSFSGGYDKLKNYASYSMFPISVGVGQSYWGGVNG